MQRMEVEDTIDDEQEESTALTLTQHDDAQEARQRLDDVSDTHCLVRRWSRFAAVSMLRQTQPRHFTSENVHEGPRAH